MKLTITDNHMVKLHQEKLAKPRKAEYTQKSEALHRLMKDLTDEVTSGGVTITSKERARERQWVKDAGPFGVRVVRRNYRNTPRSGTAVGILQISTLNSATPKKHCNSRFCAERP